MTDVATIKKPAGTIMMVANVAAVASPRWPRCLFQARRLDWALGLVAALVGSPRRSGSSPGPWPGKGA